MNGLATIVATQSLQLGAVSANSGVRSILVVVFSTIIVVIAVATIVVLFYFAFLPKWPILTFLRNMTSSFEILRI